MRVGKKSQKRSLLYEHVPRTPTSITQDVRPPAPHPFSPPLLPTTPPTALPSQSKAACPPTPSRDEQPEQGQEHSASGQPYNATPVSPPQVHSAPAMIPVLPTSEASQEQPPQNNKPAVTKKVPLALRRLASFNPEGRKGLGEYIPDCENDVSSISFC